MYDDVQRRAMMCMMVSMMMARGSEYQSKSCEMCYWWMHAMERKNGNKNGSM
ncbi:MAG: hypothetical protein P0116_06600 [Candidatus Nitrosocosmicus sp.]|nr:hypothetical protein [Candidatus Nitrosocosmicus sp.]